MSTNMMTQEDIENMFAEFGADSDAIAQHLVTDPDALRQINDELIARTGLVMTADGRLVEVATNRIFNVKSSEDSHRVRDFFSMLKEKTLVATVDAPKEGIITLKEKVSEKHDEHEVNHKVRWARHKQRKARRRLERIMDEETQARKAMVKAQAKIDEAEAEAVEVQANLINAQDEAVSAA